MQSVLELSKKAAEVALRILDGKQATSTVICQTCIANIRLATAAVGIAESNLPPGSEIHFGSRRCGSVTRGKSR